MKLEPGIGVGAYNSVPQGPNISLISKFDENKILYLAISCLLGILLLTLILMIAVYGRRYVLDIFCSPYFMDYSLFHGLRSFYRSRQEVVLNLYNFVLTGAFPIHWAVAKVIGRGS